jgi:dihydroorotate dehydrogenase
MPALRRWLTGRYLVDAPKTVFGVRFPNPVGLAAGLDKDGQALLAWPALGFGFVEVGTVTQHAQRGNDKPRLFRLPDSEAVINRMGFNNAGAEALRGRLRRLDERGRLPRPLGISLGKSKVTPLDRAVDDYLASLKLLTGYADYFAINVSSPNTAGLRSLQERGQLDELLQVLRAESAGVPLLVKIAPDLTDQAIAELLEVAVSRGVHGVIATNTTTDRAGLAPGEVERGRETGGLSGRPLAARAREVVEFVHKETGGNLPIIGVGGITDEHSAERMVDAGADLVQLCTGFIYHGPPLVKAINERLR